MSSAIPTQSAVQKWTVPDTGELIFQRFTSANLEERTVAAAELYKDAFFKTITEAAKKLRVPYKRLWSRLQGCQPVSENGGLNTMLSPEEEAEVIVWAHRRITQGHHIKGRALRQHANVILAAKGISRKATNNWAVNFMKRHSHIFKRIKTSSRDARRKAGTKRGYLEAFYAAWKAFLTKHNIRDDNVWNFDETGFMVGYLQSGIFVWTFHEVLKPVLTDPHDLVSVSALEAISATGATIPSFLILPGVNIPSSWVDNNLDEGTVLTTSAKGYVNDILVVEWIKHFELHTRPQNPEEKRVLLLDNCENHFTDELFHFCNTHNIELFPLPPKVTHLLQPLDVGVFQPYKHWHQHVLYREVAEGVMDFNKTDFLFHLQEIRNRTFKKSTILSTWEKCGLFPYNPAQVLDHLQEPLSSLSQEVCECDIPGFVDEGIYPTIAIPIPNSMSNDVNSREGTPDTIVPDWRNASTPPFNLRHIHRYHEFVTERVESSIYSHTPLTPSVARVLSKAYKADVTLALNGITATKELRQLKEKALSRTQRSTNTTVTARYGPITVGDARLRVAQDQYNRRAAQEEERERVSKRAARDEAVYTRRWLGKVRSTVRKSIKAVTAVQLSSHGWHKKQRRDYLSNTSMMCSHYQIFRELRIKVACTGGVIIWPEHHNPDTVNSAVALIVAEIEQRTASRTLLQLETDGYEITAENTVEEPDELFELIKDERDGIDSGFYTQNTTFDEDDDVAIGSPDNCIFVAAPSPY